MTGRVWVTRAAPFNHLTVKRLAAAGYEAIGAPAIDIVPLAVPPAVPVPDALLFTSLNGVRLHRFLPALADLPVLAVGDHSARYARARGYRRVVSARGNVQALCHLIQTEFKGGASLLHVGAVHTAGDLSVMLGREFNVRRLAVYDVKERDPRDLEWVCGRLDDFDHVLIHSPRAGRFVARLIDVAMPRWAGAIHCISAAAAAPFHRLRNARIGIAERPDERSLLKSLRRQKSLPASSSDRDRSPAFVPAGLSRS